MSSGVRWDLLAGLGQNFLGSYDAGRKRSLESDRIAKLQEIAAMNPGQLPSPSMLGAGLLSVGDVEGALAAGRLAQAAADRDIQQKQWQASHGLAVQQANRPQYFSDDTGVTAIPPPGQGAPTQVVKREPKPTLEQIDPDKVTVVQQGATVKPVDLGIPQRPLPVVPGVDLPANIDPKTARAELTKAAVARATTPQSLNPLVKQGTDKPPTEEQQKNRMFADVMLRGEEIIRPVEGLLAQPVEVARGRFNITASEDYQKARNAQEAWVRAKLRRESGAAIAKDEMDKEINTFFPKVGDSPAVIEQKRVLRRDATEGVMYGAGPHYQPRMRFNERAELVPHVVPTAGGAFDPSRFEASAPRIGSMAAVQPGDVMKSWADVPENAVVERGGRSFKKVNGRPVPVE